MESSIYQIHTNTHRGTHCVVCGCVSGGGQSNESSKCGVFHNSHTSLPQTSADVPPPPPLVSSAAVLLHLSILSCPCLSFFFIHFPLFDLLFHIVRLSSQFLTLRLPNSNNRFSVELFFNSLMISIYVSLYILYQTAISIYRHVVCIPVLKTHLCLQGNGDATTGTLLYV